MELFGDSVRSSRIYRFMRQIVKHPFLTMAVIVTYLQVFWMMLYPFQYTFWHMMQPVLFFYVVFFFMAGVKNRIINFFTGYSHTVKLVDPKTGETTYRKVYRN